MAAASPRRPITRRGHRTTEYQFRVWEPRTGAPVTPVLVSEAPIHDLEFSPDGQVLAVASGFPWDAETTWRGAASGRRHGPASIPADSDTQAPAGWCVSVRTADAW